MNYELAKKLKEAGFKQGNENGQECDDWIDGCYIPNLSELIEACGNKFKSLWKEFDDNKWLVNCDHLGYGGIKGVTPEEAVANLWLELNKNI